jgi:hypothetical protein
MYLRLERETENKGKGDVRTKIDHEMRSTLHYVTF